MSYLVKIRNLLTQIKLIMLKNYFKIAWRTVIRHEGYAFINISGLSVGMAVCLLIFVVVKYELSFETFRPNYKDIYHVVTREIWEDGVAYNPGVPAPTPDALRLYFPQAKIAAINKAYGSLLP
jgi:putative ABC transport system permease protein